MYAPKTAAICMLFDWKKKCQFDRRELEFCTNPNPNTTHWNKKLNSSSFICGTFYYNSHRITYCDGLTSKVVPVIANNVVKKSSIMNSPNKNSQTH